MFISFFQKLTGSLTAIFSAVLIFFNIGCVQPVCDSVKEVEFCGVKSIGEVGYTVNDYKKLIGNGAISSDFVCRDNQFKVTAGGTEIPVYTVPLYSGQKDKGTLYSFCFIEKDAADTLEIKAEASLITNPAIYPQKDFYRGFNYVSFSVQPGEEGSYTFFTNKNRDDKVLTVRIFGTGGEDEEIEEYKADFGSENVTVIEKGMHEINQLILNSDSVLYLKSGAYLKVIHSAVNGGAIKAENFRNITVAGRGILDLSNLDWHERNGLEFLHGDNLKIRDITVLNSANWSCYLYNVSYSEIRNITILGSRQNGDGIDICNCRNITVENCFVRAGDDCYNVKTLGDETDSPCENITFSRNTAWATKARAAGTTGETNCDIKDIVFDGMTVIRCDATWNDERIGAFAIVNETGNGNIENICFKNSEIVDSKCPPILISVLSGRTDVRINSIRFENINICSEKDITVCDKTGLNEINYSAENVVNSTFRR